MVPYAFSGDDSTAQLLPSQRAAGVMVDIDNNPFAEFVRDQSTLLPASRVQAYLAKMEDLVAEDKRGAKEPDGIYALIQEIVAAGDISCLGELEKKTSDLEEKKAIWVGVTRSKSAAAQELLAGWALLHPDVPELMRYHPNGPELLMELAEDKDALTVERVKCIRLLVYMNETSIISRLESLTNDPTQVFEVSMKPGQEILTVGKVAEKAIHTLQGNK